MVLSSFRIQYDYRRGPFHTESVNHRLILAKIDLEGNEILLHIRTDIGIGISNSCQLLAPNSEVIIKIH